MKKSQDLPFPIQLVGSSASTQDIPLTGRQVIHQRKPSEQPLSRFGTLIILHPPEAIDPG